MLLDFGAVCSKLWTIHGKLGQFGLRSATLGALCRLGFLLTIPLAAVCACRVTLAVVLVVALLLLSEARMRYSCHHEWGQETTKYSVLCHHGGLELLPRILTT